MRAKYNRRQPAIARVGGNDQQNRRPCRLLGIAVSRRLRHLHLHGDAGCGAVLDASARQPLFPTRPLSLSSPVGLGYWVLIIGGGTQAAITILLPLSLQIVHGLSPLWVGVANLIISIAWTIATFLVSGWSGARERFALNSGVALMLVALLMLVPTAQGERLKSQ